MGERVDRALGREGRGARAGGAEEDGWAVEEFGGVELGDARLTARLVRLATAVGAQPTASLPQACGPEPGALKAAYRFFDNDAVEPVTLVAGHVQATYARVAAVERVLAVQDTTYLDYTSHRATTGLGPLRSVAQQGLLAHTTLALTPERVPLGLLAQQVWARDRDTYASGAPDAHKTRPIAEKESQKWLTSLQAVIAARQACPTTHFISVGDREADVYELFAMPRVAGVDLLVRAAWDRRVASPERSLWAAMEATPPAAEVTVRVPRHEPQPAHDGRPARAAQPAREATLPIRFRQVTLCPPRRPPDQPRLPRLRVWAVLAREDAPPAGSEPLEWLLLTTCPVSDVAAALEMVAWYACRWGIEVFHKVLKSGCQIEARQLETADRLRRCLALYSVVAWRVLYATLLARALPDAPCTALLETEEWQALYCITYRTTQMPATPPTLRDTVRWIARLGGFLGRSRDGEPGPTTLWRGFQRLYDHTEMYRVMTRPAAPQTCG